MQQDDPSQIYRLRGSKANMSRVESLRISSLSDSQREIYDQVFNGSGQKVSGPFAIWLHVPELARHADALGRYLRLESGLPPKLIEFTILITAAHWQSEFVWNSHVPLAMETGLTELELDALRFLQQPPSDARDLEAVFDFVHGLLRDKTVDDRNWATVVEAIGHTHVINLISLVGYYGWVCGTANAAQIPSERDPSFPLPPPAERD
jgi:4-carboxymuconolactone decarboxylase